MGFPRGHPAFGRPRVRTSSLLEPRRSHTGRAIALERLAANERFAKRRRSLLRPADAPRPCSAAAGLSAGRVPLGSLPPALEPAAISSLRRSAVSCPPPPRRDESSRLLAFLAGHRAQAASPEPAGGSPSPRTPASSANPPDARLSRRLPRLPRLPPLPPVRPSLRSLLPPTGRSQHRRPQLLCHPGRRLRLPRRRFLSPSAQPRRCLGSPTSRPPAVTRRQLSRSSRRRLRPPRRVSRTARPSCPARCSPWAPARSSSAAPPLLRLHTAASTEPTAASAVPRSAVLRPPVPRHDGLSRLRDFLARAAVLISNI